MTAVPVLRALLLLPATMSCSIALANALQVRHFNDKDHPTWVFDNQYWRRQQLEGEGS